jgi:hypothetical protein
MSLLNGLLALGTLAFVVPLVIHLLYRNRFRILDWGAMHLLTPVVQTNRRRMQWMNLILLLIRCAIPIVLALCLARPLLTGWNTAPADAPRTVVLVIDNSYSMTARDASGEKRFDAAKMAASGVLESLTRRDEVIVIPTSRIQSTAGIGGHREAATLVGELQADGGPVSLETMVRAGVAAASQATHASPSLIVISDFNEATAGDFDRQSLTDLGTSWSKEDKNNANPKRPDVTLLTVGSQDPSLAPDNVSIDAIEVLDPAIIVSRGFGVSARIENRSDQPVRDAEVVWTIDAQDQSPRPVTLGPRSSAVVTARGKFDQPGVNEIKVRINTQDSLAFDNQRRIGVDVIQSVEVAMVEGRPGNGPMSNESDFLAIALSPYAMDGNRQRDAVRVTEIKASEIRRRLERSKEASNKNDQTEFKVLILAGVPSVPEDSVRGIQAFVESGGHLIVLDGDQVETSVFQNSFRSWPLPATMGEIVSETEADTIQTQVTASYQPWGELADESGQVGLQFRKRRKLTTQDDTAQVLWKTPSDQPLAITANRGLGSVTQFALAATDRWSSWPLRPIFLPMIQQLVLDLAGASAGINVPLGGEITVLLSGQNSEDQSQWRVTRPDGSSSTIAARDKRIAVAASMPGRYLFVPTADSQAKPIVRIATTPQSESDLRPMTQSELTAVAQSLAGTVQEKISDWKERENIARNGREIWRYLWWIVLALLFIELWWQQRSTSRIRNPSPQASFARTPT